MEKNTMKKQSFQLIKQSDNRILIKEFQFKSNYYPYNDVYNMIEISLEFDNATMKVNDRQPFTYRLLRSETDTLANWQNKESAINYVSEKSIIACERQLKKQFRELKKELELSHKTELFLKLEAIANETIKHYQTDFYYHDALQLYRNNPVKFLWVIRDCGSWLITKKSQFNNAIIADCTKNNNQFYFIDNGNVQSITSNQAMSFYGKLENQD
jgi:hypothetical protein